MARLRGWTMRVRRRRRMMRGGFSTSPFQCVYSCVCLKACYANTWHTEGRHAALVAACRAAGAFADAYGPTCETFGRHEPCHDRPGGYRLRIPEHQSGAQAACQGSSISLLTKKTLTLTSVSPPNPPPPSSSPKYPNTGPISSRTTHGSWPPSTSTCRISGRSWCRLCVHGSRKESEVHR